MNKSFFIFIPLLTSFICSCAFINESSSNKELSNNEYSKVIRSNEDNKNLNLGDESATRNSLNTSETSSNSGKINKVVLKKNIFEKISSNFSLKNLQSKRVKISLKRLTRDPKYVERVFNRSAPYLREVRRLGTYVSQWGRI